MAKIYDLKNPESLSFDDVLLTPQHSDIYSRLDVELTANLTKNIKISHPVVSTNMSTVTEYKMAKFMGLSGSAGFLHRFDPSNMIEWAKLLKSEDILCVPSVGTKEEDRELVDNIVPYADAILIDIAHGDSQMVIDMIKYIKYNYPKIDVIAGNIATRDGFRRLADSGADGIRGGISGGSACTNEWKESSQIVTQPKETSLCIEL